MRVLRNARLADGRLVDITVDTAEGTITSVTDAGTSGSGSADGTGAGTEIGSDTHDLGGWLVIAAMAEPHAHLDKALTADEIPNPKGDLMGAIEAWFAAAEAGRLSYERTVERATQAFEMLLVHGVTAVRTHINVTADIGITSVLAVQEAARAMEGLIDFQMVALTGWPMTGPDRGPNVRALEEAIEAGVDLVGGCPNLQDDPRSHIADMLALASSAGLDIDFHTDETLDPSVLTLRELARQIADKGFDGIVAASHCVSLGMQSPDVQAAVAAEVAAAEISVITLPQTNLFLQGRDDPTATPRGLTAVQPLVDAGVTVAAGADNVQDPFNLVGRSDPLETAALMVMAGHRQPDAAYDMVSNCSRQAMGLAPVNFEPGDPADFVAIDAPTLRGAVSDAPMSRRVYRRGQLVAKADQQTQILRP